MKVSRRRVEEMMDDVDEDGSGEVELPEFEQIMTYHLHGGDGSNKDDKGSGVPFHVMATRFARWPIGPALPLAPSIIPAAPQSSALFGVQLST